ncbi:MAG: tRNA 2-thiocytidine biosynthesis protein TtcA [Clostridiales bacterium]|nr:tRNA 2-thiocytidine biosynthesis protein TtcA [Clostridiales bacterium]
MIMDGFTGLVRRCIEDYSMLEEGDRVAVGLSGGKDSLSLLAAMADMRAYFPKKFYLSAITVDMGFEDMDLEPLHDLCRSLGVPYIVEKTNIASVVFKERKEKNPCSLCVRMRKGVLNSRLAAEGINKVALGHNLDDAVETFFMSLLREGRIYCFSPVTFLDRSGITQIRPLLYLSEEDTTAYSRRRALPIVKSTCPVDKAGGRQDAKELVRDLCADYSDLKAKVFGAMQRYPLPGWKPEHHQRLPSSR